MTPINPYAEDIAGAVAMRLAEMFRSGEQPVTPEFLTAAQVSQMTGFSQKALETYRSKRIGPPFLKVGKSVRYRAADVRAWIEARGPVS
ncbi:MAG: helix-turn-helix transcriptional regulator [Aestuariivirga sp.]